MKVPSSIPAPMNRALFVPTDGIPIPRHPRLWFRHLGHLLLRARGLRHVHGQGGQPVRRGFVLVRGSRRWQERSPGRSTSSGLLQEDPGFGKLSTERYYLLFNHAGDEMVTTNASCPRIQQPILFS